MASFAPSDDRDGSKYGADALQIESVPLTELIIQHGAPQFVDYLSIDTVGPELDILAAHDLNDLVSGQSLLGTTASRASASRSPGF